eukprot:CCRYP_020684-RA/>CCRYP_020684-RA protein AED:0.43 eAED:0.27 QI:0/-1/0/1/-1/0/1/0/131
MRDHGGNIINITLGNRIGMPNMVNSGAARAGIENITTTLSKEWMESSVCINCTRPGIVWTDSGFENYGPAGDQFVGKILPSLPAKRFASPEEISSALCWLLSEEHCCMFYLLFFSYELEYLFCSVVMVVCA